MLNDQSSSLHAGNKVASCNDLVTEILSRLPVRTLLRFKSVSKHWYSLITNPSFKRLHPDPPSGLFVPREYSYLGYKFVPLDIANPVKLKPLFEPLTNIDEGVRILDSCNGLVLCWCLCTTNFSLKYYVYNPTTNKFITLPKLELAGTNFDITLAFNPSESPHYRIVYVHSNLAGGYNCQIDIYSSETHTFNRSYKLSFDQLEDIDFESGVYWNNTIHWRNHSGFVLYFNLDQEGGTNQIQTPFGVRFPNYYPDSSYIFESRDHLLLVENRPHTLEFNIHELKRDYSGWFVIYHFDLHQLGRLFPEIIHPDHCSRFQFDVLSLVLGEKEDDLFLVLKIPNKIVRFNLVSETFHKLRDFTSSSPSENNIYSTLHPRFVRQYVYQFMASLYSV